MCRTERAASGAVSSLQNPSVQGRRGAPPVIAVFAPALVVVLGLLGPRELRVGGDEKGGGNAGMGVGIDASASPKAGRCSSGTRLA